MGISVGVGLVSGLDFNSIVSQLMELERRPIAQQETRLLTLQAKQEAYQAMDLRINALRDALLKMDSALDFESKSVTLSDGEALSASATATAPAGSYSVDVFQLATNERRASQGVADSRETTIASGGGSFQLRLGSGDLLSFDVSATTTMAELRDMINNAEGDISATIVNDGTATNPYRLVLSGKSTGQDNAIAIVQNDTTLAFTTPTIEDAVAAEGNQYTGAVTASGSYTGEGTRNVVVEVTTAGAVGEARFRVSLDGGVTWGEDDAFTASATAQDVTGAEGVMLAFADDGSTFAVGDQFSVDAFNPLLQAARDTIARVDGITVRRSTNVLNDVAPGLSITAMRTTDSAVRIDVAQDTSAVSEAINSFVSVYNALVTEAGARANFDVENQSAQPLFGESSVTSLRVSLASVVSSGIATRKGVVSLAALGISTQRDGTLAVDGAKLSAAIADDLEAVKQTFATVGESATAGIGFVRAGSSTAAGTYNVMITQAAERAEVRGGQAIAALAENEILTFTVDSESFQTTLEAGSTASQIVAQLNALFDEQGVQIEALQQSGELILRTVDYGSKTAFSVVSNREATGQTGIGTVEQAVTGVDVAGFIDGEAALGAGQGLSGAAGSRAEGLELLITATAPTSGSVVVSRGAASSLLARIETYTDRVSGILKTRRDGIASSIEDVNERIRKLEERMSDKEATLRAQFSHLETVLAQFQSQGEFLSSQLAQLSQIKA